MRLDAHHHLWHYVARDFAWIADEAAMLRRDFVPQDLVAALDSAHVAAAVAVQARCSLEETNYLLQCAAACPRIAAVVGWVPLTSPDVSSDLDQFAANPVFAGVREIVQDQPSGFMLQPDFHRGIEQLTTHDLTYDLLIRAEQLPEAMALVDRHPRQRFVLDHAAKPNVKAGAFQPWRANLEELGQRPNVLCKLSGLVTEASWSTWTENDLHPYLDACLQAFGPERCMAGSDWPVCLVATTYPRWWQVLERWAEPLSAPERSRISGQTAAEFYRCQHRLPSLAEVTG